MDMDFESQYADELDLLNEIENEVQNENKPATKTLTQSSLSKEITSSIVFPNENNDASIDEPDEEFPEFEDDELPKINDENSLNKKARFDATCTVTTSMANTNIDARKLLQNSNDLQQFARNRTGIIFDDNRKSTDLSITLLNGERKTVKLFETESTIKNVMRQSRYLSLLERPVEALKVHLTTQIVNKCKTNMDDIEQNGIMREKSEEHELWVEKYSPKSYIDLLSDDGINRLLLTWIKSWDHVVFGKELPSNEKKQQKFEQPINKKRKRIFNQNEIELDEKLSELDEYKRPKIKVALLSGAPGLGKTTLAHIVASRAGYNVIELNASDDRSAETFKQHIESVTQIRGNVNDKNFKPNCLVIDEIDGAPQNSVQVLVNHLTENTKKAKSKDGPTILRPIICICNDLYAPSLKQLRQVSIVFQCPPLVTHRLAERLYAICEQNNLGADLDALIALSDKSNNDIRSCLNTLQFLAKTTNKITAKTINQLNVGQKDYEKGMFTVLNEIFYSTNYKKMSGASKVDAMSSILNKFSYIVNLCSNTDTERLTQALHENFLSTKIRDSNFESIRTSYDWFMFCDTLNRQIKEKQDFGLYSYQRYLPVLFNMLFSSTSQQTKKLQYPHSDYECYIKTSKNDNILTHFLSDTSASVRVAYNTKAVTILELLPFLTEVIQPNLRAVSVQLFSKTEKEKFDNLIRTMILFNLNYRQERCADGQYSYVLEPAFDDVIRFSGLKQRKQICYMIKQQISREITMERLKMADKYKTAGSLSQDDGKKSTNPSTGTNNFFQSPIGAKAASILNKMKGNNIRKDKEIDAKKDDLKEDLFARYFKKIPKKEVPKSNEAEKENQTVAQQVHQQLSPRTALAIKSHSVYLRYKEGFINAVRYNVKINKLV